MDETAAPPPPEADPTDPYLRGAQTFPRLGADMLARIAPLGSEEAVPAGRHLYRRGERSVDFFVVLDGEINVCNEDAAEAPPVVVLRAGQFTGETNLFNDRQSLVSLCAAVDSRVLRVPRATFRRLTAAEPDIGELVTRAVILRRMGFLRHGHGSVTVLGDGHGRETLRLQRFLERNYYPHRLLDTAGDAAATALMQSLGLGAADLPAVVAPGQTVLRRPTAAAVADWLGISERVEDGVTVDVAVVGAGPAGLAAAVYAASEGLTTIVIEQEAPGGQAGTSSKIENYLGFPTGISGAALAGRAQVQAQKFGARLSIARAATELVCEGPPYTLRLEDGGVVRARAVVVATGARYRRLDLPNYARFEGQGIHYAATALEAGLCEGQEVVLVGGGNSAGQAAMYLSRIARHVHMLVRGPGLAATMSDYLVGRIASSPRITLHTATEIVALDGDAALERVTWRDAAGRTETCDAGNLFVMIGADPNTAWLGGCLPADPQGFVLTGRDAAGRPLDSPYATPVPGVYAVGDVRSGSVKRVASAVGEGSVVVQAIHRFLHPAA